MPQDIEDRLKRWYQSLDPDLEPDAHERPIQDWYVELDPWTDPTTGATHHLRGPSAREELIQTIELTGDHVAGSTQLFSGFRGSGKSTELARVRLELERQYSVVALDVGKYHPRTRALTIEELVLILSAGLVYGVEEQQGWKPRSVGGLKGRLEELVRKIEVPDIELGPIKIRDLLGGETTFREKLRNLQRDRPEELRVFLHSLCDEVAEGLPKPLVLLVDNLEKYFASPHEIPDIYQATADLFRHYPEVLRLPRSHVIYTVPPYLAFLDNAIGDRYSGRPRALYSVRVHGRPPKRAPDDAAVRALGQILEQWVDLDELLGPERDARLQRIATASGGHVRDLLRLTQEIVQVAFGRVRKQAGDVLPVRGTDVEGTLKRVSNTRGFLFQETRSVLEALLEERRLGALSREQLRELTVAFDQYMVLSYSNGEPWYDVHPLILEQVQRKEQ